MITCCIRERIFEDEVTWCFVATQQCHGSKWSPFSLARPEETGGGLGVIVRGFPCLHLHYFTPTSAANFLLISPAGFSCTLPLLRSHCMFAFARVRPCAQCPNAVSKRLLLLKQPVQPKFAQERTSSYKVISRLTEHLPQHETEWLQKCDVRVVIE